jgi:hypothetical protein
MIFDRDLREADGRVQDGHVAPRLRVRGGDDLYVRPDPDRSSDAEPTRRVEEAALADESLVADDHPALVVSLEDRPVPDVHVLAQLDVLGVEDEHARLKDAVRAAARELLGNERSSAVASVTDHLGIIHARRAPLEDRGREPRAAEGKRRDDEVTGGAGQVLAHAPSRLTPMAKRPHSVRPST